MCTRVMWHTRPPLASLPTYAGPFVFAVDHCFPIKGQGTVMTGTVLQGGTRIGEVGLGRWGWGMELGRWGWGMELGRWG